MENFQKLDISTLFIGSKGENINFLKELIEISINSSSESRIEYNKEDPSIFGNDYFISENFKKSSIEIKEKTQILCNYLKKSTQFSSLKYQGHMVDDPLISGFIGTITGLLYNSNNCTPQASIKSSYIEYAYNIDICKMIGFDCTMFPELTTKLMDENIKVKNESHSIYPFAHITNCGTISNIEGCWSSYWVKFIPVATKNAILNEIKLKSSIDFINVTFCDGITSKKLIECTNWELINLNSDISVNLPYLVSLYSKLPMNLVLQLIRKHHPCCLGNYNFFCRNEINPPIFIIPSSAHYSFNKCISLLGLGLDSIHSICIKSNGRMNINELKNKIEFCKFNQIPIVNVVGILGTTQEYAVDNIDEIISLRNEFRKYNFNFDIHVDGAFGGYLLSCIRDNYPLTNPLDDQYLYSHDDIYQNQDNEYCPIDYFDPELILGDHLKKQLNACKLIDTMTIDGHKSGFLPYSNSVICYRNSKYKDILSNSSVYITGGNKSTPNVGIYGIEGSRPGHISISSYLTHSILRPTKLGYGKLLKRCILNSKVFFVKLLLFFNGDIKKRNGIKAITIGNQPSNEILKYLENELIDQTSGKLKSLKSITSNYHLLQILSNIGSDTNGVCFCFNYYDNDSGVNLDYLKFIDLNQKIIERFNYLRGPETDLILSNTCFTDNYGNKFISNLLESIGLYENLPKQFNQISIPVLRSTIMSPFIGETDKGSFLDHMIDILFEEIKKILNK